MFKKFNILIILLLFLMSVAAVSAVDDVNDTVGSDEVIADSLESDYQEDVSLSVEEVQEDLSASQVTINSGNYNTYFDSNGKYKGDSSDLVFSGSFSGKNFTDFCIGLWFVY